MVISQTPLRVSFFGGGTDFEDYYKEEGGLVISTSINKYIYILISPREDKKIYLNYNNRELVDNVDDIDHEITREVLKLAQVTESINITCISDITSRGCGLGSSSAFTVGLLNAIYTYKGMNLDKNKLAELACKIEIDILGSPIGKQDQYMVAHGGFNKCEFNTDGTVTISKLNIDGDNEDRLKEAILMFNTGITRKVAPILNTQKANIKINVNQLNMLKNIAMRGENILHRLDFKKFGDLLNENWENKKQLSNKINNAEITKIYELGMKAGAYGGKLLGGGGGGFFLFICPRKNQSKLRASLKYYRECSFDFDKNGSRIIINNN